MSVYTKKQLMTMRRSANRVADLYEAETQEHRIALCVLRALDRRRARLKRGKAGRK